MKERATLLRILGTILSMILLIYLLSQQGWDEILLTVKQIPIWRLVLAMGLISISRLAVSARWHLLLRSINIKITFWQSLSITLAGLFASNFLPTTIGGDVVRLAAAIQLGYDAALCAASLIVDRIVGLAGMIMAVPFSLPNLLMDRVPTPLSIGSAILNWSAPGGWWQKTREKTLQLTRRLIEALAHWLRRPYSLFQALLLSWAHMLCIFLILNLVLTGMGENISIWSIAGLYSLVYLVTLIPISINGYGVQEISMTLVFSRFAGISIHASLGAALLFRTIMMIASLPGAFFVPDILAAKQRLSDKNRQNG